jgi:aspartyl-tRNA(Asn)/glutamyl-tRNA(Gln) amidotransferase subunit A
MDIQKLTIKKFGENLRKKEFSALEVTDAYIKRAEEDMVIRPYITLCDGAAREEARYVDGLVQQGTEMHPLAGVPLGIKDNILMEGIRTTAGSKILDSYIGSYDATVVKKIKDTHAVILGKTNLDEFAMGSSNENSAFYKTRNPHDTTRVPGGSSGGSAAAVAGDFALGALGSDTGGSIREPASFCGIVGMKPTYGSVSRFGLIALASSLDQIGPFGKTVEDAAIIFDTIKGHDAHDATSKAGEYAATSVYDEHHTKGLTLGVPREYFEEQMDTEVSRAVEDAIYVFKKSGFLIKEISLPHTKYAVSVYYVIMTAEASSNLARFDGVRYERNSEKNTLWDIYKETRGRGFGDEVKRRILLGTFVLSSGYYDAYYLKAQKVRKLITNDFEYAFDKKNDGVDVILAPVVPTKAFKIGEKISDPIAMYLSDIFTIPANFAGLPAVSLPVKKYPLGKELPVGFQIIGKPFHEKDIMNLGMWYERETGSR